MICGAPNAGKSFLALFLVVRMQEAVRGHSRLPTLYVSADTDDATMRVRTYAMLTGQETTEIEQAREMGLDFWFADRVAWLDSDVQWCWDSDPDLRDLELEVLAFEEQYGEPPALIVIDNLMNVRAETDNEWAGMRELMKAFHHLARATGAAVLVLHHTSEDAQYSATEPPPRRAIQGKVAQLPELILTVATSGDTLGLAVVKNRNGSSDPQAKEPLWMSVDLSKMALSEGYYARAVRT